MLKNKLQIIFALYFLITSVGISYGKHTCGGKTSTTLLGVNISSGNKCTCNHDEKKDHDSDCCKDEISWVKAKTDGPKIQASSQISKLNFPVVIFCNFLFSLNSEISEQASTFEVSHSPPLPGIPLFLRVRTLLI